MIRSIKGKKILAATHNQGKLEEITALLEPLNVKVVSAKDLNLPEPDETEETFVGNARIKAHAGAKSSGLPSLSDDSGIEIDALDGAPGVYTADWAATPAGRDFEIAMKKAHSLLDKKNVPFPRTGRFSCTLVLAWPNGEDLVFQGKIDGIIVWPMRGDQGHGYDPIFQPDGYQVTFGEMDRWEKNKISHRAKAFENLIEHFSK